MDNINSVYIKLSDIQADFYSGLKGRVFFMMRSPRKIATAEEEQYFVLVFPQPDNAVSLFSSSHL